MQVKKWNLGFAMSQKVMLRVDIAFKKLFGVDENKDLLISLINSVVSKEDQVKTVEILNPYNFQDFKTEKLSILDIKAKGPTGKRYCIELQISDDGDYDKRALYYWGKAYTQQLSIGMGYSKLNKTIGIHILNFISIPETKKYHNVFRPTDTESGVHYFKDMELHTIELSKFEDQIKGEKLDDADELKLLLPKVKTSLDRWVAFLTRHNLLNKHNLPEELNDPHLEKALKIIEVMNLSDEERDAYEAHLHWLRIEESTLKKAKEEAREEGIGIGRAKEKEETTRKMLSQGIDINIIASSTGLTIRKIEAIKKTANE
jgi:predicted transposase/invertase (TIGR01784 family)